MPSFRRISLSPLHVLFKILESIIKLKNGHTLRVYLQVLRKNKAHFFKLLVIRYFCALLPGEYTGLCQHCQPYFYILAGLFYVFSGNYIFKTQ